MPDSTNDYGGSWDLTIPNGSDSVDIVRDVGTLGVETDFALSWVQLDGLYGINVDTSVDADGNQVTDFSGGLGPLRLYGAGRPDGLGGGSV